ncbi:MAG TPA: zf-HC2 domain-containing protein [Armatimonadota bacterium]|nr:zf-HC2 domain-containing protein [Armatimonadota bacterium]
MRCRDVIDRFSRYRDGDLGAGERRELEAHLGACVRCREEFAALEAVLRSLRELQAEPAPPALVGAVRARLQARGDGPRAVMVRWAVPVAAAALLAVAAFGVMHLTTREEPSFRSRTAAQAPARLRDDSGDALRQPPLRTPAPMTGAAAPSAERPAPPVHPGVPAATAAQPRGANGREPSRPSAGYAPTKAEAPAVSPLTLTGPPPMGTESPRASGAGAESAVTKGRTAAEQEEHVPSSAAPSVAAEPATPSLRAARAAVATPGEGKRAPAADLDDALRFGERAATSIAVTAQASHTQLSNRNLTLQLKPNDDVEDAQVSLRSADARSPEVVLWQGRLDKSRVNNVDVQVAAPGPDMATQQLVIRGAQVQPQAYYVFAPVSAERTEAAPAGAAGPSGPPGPMTRVSKGKPTASATWDEVLQGLASGQGVYVLAPEGFPTGRRAGLGARPAQKTIAKALERMGYALRGGEGTLTIWPVPQPPATPGRAKRSHP